MVAEKTLGQTYHEEVEALKTQGTPNGEAIRLVAEKHGKNPNAVRGGIRQYTASRNGTPVGRRGSRGRSVIASVDGHLAMARKSLEDALALVEEEPAKALAEVERLKLAVVDAEGRYENAVAAAKERKADLVKKIKALS